MPRTSTLRTQRAERTGPAPSVNAAATARPVYSCEPCRKRKVKCDRKRHCRNCVRRGETCVWRQTPPFSSLHVSHSAQIDDPSLTNRVAYLERLVQSAGLDAQAAYDNAQNAINAHAPHPLGATTTTPLRSPPPPSPPSIVPPVALAISDLVEPRTDSPNVEIGLHDRFDHQILTATSAASDACVARAQPLLRLLPARNRCDALLDMYFETLEWIHHPVHVPSFNRWYRQFWKHGLAARHCVQQLALLFSMLCLAVHFGLDDDQHDDGLSASLSETQDNVFYQASYDALVASDYLGHHSLTNIQTIILQGLYLNNTGQTTTHHVNLGLAIRMANTMGLSSLDSTQPQDKMAAALSASSDTRDHLKMEMGRRIYWSLVCQDCYTASSCNFTYSIQPSQIKTRVFSNLRDDMLVSGSNGDSEYMLTDASSDQLQGLPHATPTTSSYHIAKIPFAITARKTVDMHNQGTLTYEAVLQLEQENRNHFHALPHFLRLDKPEGDDGDASHLLGWGRGHTKLWNPARVYRQQIQWQRLFLGITLHNRILRLHRPYLTRAFTNPAFQASKRSAQTSARHVLSLADHGRKIAFPGLRWWVVLVHIFTAAIALCIDLHFTNVYRPSIAEDLQSHQAENTRLIQLAISILHTASSRSRTASRALQIVTTLFEQAQISPHTRRSTRRSRHTRQDTDAVRNVHLDSHASSPPVTTFNGSSPVQTSVQASQNGATTTHNFETWLGSDWSSLLDSHVSASLTPVTTDVLTADLLQSINAFVASDSLDLPSS